MKKLMFTLVLLSALTGQAQAELKWKKMQAGASGGMTVPVITGTVVGSDTVKTTGINSYGHLGDGTTINKSTPVTIVGLQGAKNCYANYLQTFCIMSDGSVKATGKNTNGQLGDGTTTDKSTPITINGLEGAKEISVGEGASGYNYIVAVMNDGKVKFAGSNGSGQFGVGSATTTNSNPVISSNFNLAKQCDAGAYYTVCVMNDSKVKFAGSNGSGQFGNGATNQTSLTPVLSSLFEGAKQCSAGSDHTVCIMNDGTVKASGLNHGRLGDGTTTLRSTPVTIVGFQDAKQCSAHSAHTVCVMNNGTVKATGNNTDGQLGDGTTTNQLSPITIAGFAGAKQCSAGFKHTVCVMNDGSVKAAGNNEYGQLGTTENSGTIIPNPIPITIPEWQGATQCQAGQFHTVCSYGGIGQELPTCDSLTDFFGKTADGTKYICKGNLWTEL